MSYHCPVCKKVSHASLDLARHMIGRGDKVHRDWIYSKGFKYSELLLLQIKSFGVKALKPWPMCLKKRPR